LRESLGEGGKMFWRRYSIPKIAYPRAFHGPGIIKADEDSFGVMQRRGWCAQDQPLRPKIKDGIMRRGPGKEM